jgi:FkbM family methyltransferase
MLSTNFIWDKVRLLGKLPGSLAVFYFISNLFYRNGSTVKIKTGPIKGYKWKKYQCHQPWMAYGLYEPAFSNLLVQSLSEGMIFFDIGANAGYYTLIGAKCVRSRGRVIAFEPVPFNVDVINEQIQLNDLAAFCTVEPVAVNNANQKVQLVIPERNANSHIRELNAPHVRTGGDTAWVESISLDSYVEHHGIPDVIKMDIEGAEVEALKGAEKLLASRKTLWFVSIHSETLCDEVMKIFQQSGYITTKTENYNHMVIARVKEST